MNFNATFIGQLIAFAVFVVFCMKYVWPPLMAAIEERQKKIADGLEASERAEKDLELAQAKATEQLKAAKAQAAEIIEQAKSAPTNWLTKKRRKVTQNARKLSRLVMPKLKQNAIVPKKICASRYLPWQ